MLLKNCNVLLDSRVYYPGQRMNGEVRISLDNSLRVRSLTVICKGEAVADWSEVHYTSSPTDTVEGRDEEHLERYSGTQQFFKNEQNLLNDEYYFDELPSGMHKFFFFYTLPFDIPSSYEGKYGYVRYTIQIILVDQTRSKKDAVVSFMVFSPVDLNAYPRLQHPYVSTLNKSFGFLCCKSEPLSVTTRIPMTAYMPGKGIPCTCECVNKSNVDINKVKLSLIKQLTFQTRLSQTKDIKETLSEMNVGTVPEGSSRTFSQTLQIPNVSVFNTANCKIIRCKYFLQIECSVGGMHKSLTGIIPIVLGDIPYSSQASVQYPNDKGGDTPSSNRGGQDSRSTPAQPIDDYNN